MTTPHLKKSIGRSPSRLGFFLAALAVACFALMPFAQSAQAVGPEPNEDDLIGNVTEEDNAVLDLSTDTESGAMGQSANHPNHREIIINSIADIPCAEKVELRGKLRIKFGVVELRPGARFVQPVDIKLEGFSGTGKTIGRKYVKEGHIEVPGGVKTEELNGLGSGTFKLRFLVTGKPKPQGAGDPNPEKVFRFKLSYTVVYKYSTRDNEVNSFKDTRKICCRGSDCF